jgi:hypothetical protein
MTHAREIPCSARYFAVAEPAVTISFISAAMPCPRRRSAIRTRVVGLFVRNRMAFPMLRSVSRLSAAAGVVFPPTYSTPSRSKKKQSNMSAITGTTPSLFFFPVFIVSSFIGERFL